MKLIWMLFVLVLFAYPVRAQDEAVVISADNVRQLQSVEQLDFAALPEDMGEVSNGWFALSSNGESYAMLNRAGGVVYWNFPTEMLKTSSASCSEDGQPGGFITGGFPINSIPLFVDWLFTAVYISGDSFYIGFHNFRDDVVARDCETVTDFPVNVWTESVYTFVEILPQSGDPYVLARSLLINNESQFDTEPVETWPSGPENDPDSFLRVGRIEPPLALTVTQDNLLKRWNLQTGEVTATIQLHTLPGGGQVNASGTHFAWRDGDSQALHLLDFETGEDRIIAQLGGQFIPFLFLTPAADVIIGVNVDLKPVVMAWDVQTAEQIIVGEYRTCNRQPDMVRLSQDGSTLAIGCDTGLDIWQVAAEN